MAGGRVADVGLPPLASDRQLGCEVAFTSHERGGLTENDFACAARLDRLVDMRRSGG